ncbi:hypothetical protein CHOED_075 [Vibrio phage CHOED]|uniref:hypothetical protein n=1 Tax=Vibrio phage CHOED TaxID=1458716 RepID=UPI00042E1D85|nr:hypothetical protein CHOED_075 [Vibrio phage CHOED]AHK11935.1 hypothetical protein CHOED_075 [Vibrio phage CHOED]
MLKLARTTHIIFMDSKKGERYPVMGWNGLNNAMRALAHRYGEQHEENPVRTLDAVQTLRERGYLAPQDTLEDAYWIIEKAIPKELLERVWNQEVEAEEVIKQLKV